ncbi:hypothetical protein LDENG_00126650 [Lucifuga dentata]|nr:hypothetical protein LDENG_00126650 [Lucifuga dentata]
MTEFKHLRELVLLDEFKNCIPENTVVYLNEQKVSSLSSAAVLADEFALTHKDAFSSPVSRNYSVLSDKKSPRRNASVSAENRPVSIVRTRDM